MKVYISSSYSDRARAIGLMQTLLARGMLVTSSWLRSPPAYDSDEDRRKAADQDLADVRDADVLVAWTRDSSSQPRFTYGEIGAALEVKKPVLWVGNNGTPATGGEPLMFWATGVERLYSIEALLVVLGELHLRGLPALRSGITLRGWRCGHCGLFNGEEKELREDCRGCGRAR